MELVGLVEIMHSIFCSRLLSKYIHLSGLSTFLTSNQPFDGQYLI